MGRVVLVTGVSRHLGGRMARILTDDPTVSRVIGVDVIPPVQDIGRAEFVRADIRNPIIAKVITAAEVVPWGVRVECRLDEPAEETLEIPVAVVARSPA